MANVAPKASAVNAPQSMRVKDRWVNWRYDQKKGGKKTKVPCDATGKKVDGTKGPDADYRITWCERLGCIFDESWTIRTAPSQDAPPAAPPAPLRIDPAPASGSCGGADCSPAAADL